MKKIFALCLGLLLCLSLCACGASEEGETENEDKHFSYDDLDLKILVDEIYRASNLGKLTAESISSVKDETTLTEQYYLDLSKIEAFDVRSAEGNFGAADIAVILVKEGESNDGVMESLEKRKDDRINEFLDYDVYDSYNVALNAEIYEEGRLVVMLMLSEDAIASGKTIIDRHLE